VGLPSASLLLKQAVGSREEWCAWFEVNPESSPGDWPTIREVLVQQISISNEKTTRIEVNPL
jgi:hypothetical protein